MYIKCIHTSLSPRSGVFQVNNSGPYQAPPTIQVTVRCFLGGSLRSVYWDLPAPFRSILTVSGWFSVHDTLVGPKYVIKNLGYLAVHSRALWSRALLPPFPKNCQINRQIINESMSVLPEMTPERESERDRQIKKDR